MKLPSIIRASLGTAGIRHIIQAYENTNKCRKTQQLMQAQSLETAYPPFPKNLVPSTIAGLSDDPVPSLGVEQGCSERLDLAHNRMILSGAGS